MPPFRVLAALLVLAPAPALAAIARDGAVNPRASGSIGDRGPVTDTNGHLTWSLPGVPEDLDSAASVHVDGPRSSVDPRSHINAHWDSATHGTINTDNTFSANNPVAPIDMFFSVENPEAQPLWTYQFTTTSDGTFDFDFRLDTVGLDASGLGVWDLILSREAGAQEAIRFHTLNGLAFDDSGTVSRALLGGQTYRVSLVSREQLTVANAANGRNTTEFGTFDWTITETGTAVPEPSAWALAILGMGLAGATLRRRRSVCAA